MRRIIVKETRPGMRVMRALAHPRQPGVALIETGVVLTTRHIVQLHELGIYDLWVEDGGLEFLDNLCCTQPSPPQQRLAEAMRESLFHFAGHAPRALIKRYDLMVEELLGSLLRAAAIVPCFRAFTEDEALLSHSCDVAVLTMFLGFQLEGYLVEQRRRLNTRQARDVLNLVLGALFHDVGELMLPVQERESRRAQGSVEEEEGASDLWKQHAEEGYVIVHGKLDPSAAVVVQRHHERFDGKGFGGTMNGGGGGKGQAGTGIHVHARIAMAADVFSKVSWGGAGGNGGGVRQPMVKALWQIQQMPMRQWFDPVVHQALMGMVPPFVEGMVVTFADSSQGVVTRVDAAMPCYPEVTAIDGGRQMGEEMTLAAQGGAAIHAVDGWNVQGYLYGVQRGRPLVAA